ncbi:MAG: DUF2304 domain-containing protein [Oscillospiraceae bacterium]
MDTSLRIFLGIGLIFYFAMLFYMLKKGRLILKYTLFWILAGIVLIVFLICPKALYVVSDFIGVSNPVNGVFLLFAGISLLLLLSLTSIVSQFNRINRGMIQSMATLEKRVRELEDKLESTENKR